MNKKLKIAFCSTLCFIVFGFAILQNSCSNNDESDPDVLAVIGDKVVYNDDFVTRFQQARQKSGLPDNGQVRRQILQNMVNEELLIIEAKRKGFDNDEAGKLKEERIKIQELLNIFHQKNIQDQITITDEELKKLYVQLNTKIKARHLYAPTKEKADSLLNLLFEGGSFEELAKDVFDDPALRDSGGLLGYFSVDDMELNFEEAAFQMEVGQISNPIKTTDGYSIIRVDDRFTNPVLTETEFLKNKNKLRSFLIPRKIKKATQFFTDSLRKQLKIEFDIFALEQLFLTIQKNPEKDFFSDIEEKNFDYNQLEKLNIATTQFENWNLKKFQNHAIFTSASQRKWIRSKENLKDFLSGLIIRANMLRNAKKSKLDKTKEYEQKVQVSWENYLLTRIEDSILNEITIPEDTLQHYYSSDPTRFSEPPKIRLQEIVVRNEKLAEKVTELHKKGNSFEQLAREYSERKWSAEKGGDLGYLYPEDFGKWSNQIFQLKIGQITPAYRMDSHFVIFKCIDKIASRILSFEEAYDEVEKSVRYIKKEEQRDKKIREIKNTIPNLKVFSERLKHIQMMNIE